MNVRFRSLWGALSAGLLLGASALAATKEPVIITGPACPEGSKRTVPWVMYEDRDGDGKYDFMLAGDCNGDVRGRPWTTSFNGDPFSPMPTDLLIARLPQGSAGINPDLSYRLLPNGLYAWTISDRTPTGMEVCRYERDAAGVLGATCPPGEGTTGGDDTLH